MISFQEYLDIEGILELDQILEIDQTPHSADDVICEMSTIGRNLKWGDKLYRVVVHGPSTKDRDYPHIHIHYNNDMSGTRFNFEISLVHIVCEDRLVLVAQIDKDNNSAKFNKMQTLWTDYRKVKEGLEEFLKSPVIVARTEFTSGLEACIVMYNNESNGENAFLDYCTKRGLKILPKYAKLVENAQI